MRSPLLHFLVLGAVLFAGQRWLLPEPSSPPAPIRLSDESGERIRREWLARSGRLPDEEEWRALRREALDEEMLYREALARGLHENDAVVARRLIRNMRFLEEDGPEGTGQGVAPSRGASSAGDAELYREALALGMHESDLVVRRRLVQKVRLEVYARARMPEPTDEELEAYLASHGGDFREPEQVRIYQVYLSRDRRGESVQADADALLVRLRAGAAEGQALGSTALGETGLGEMALRELGDPLPLPTSVPMRSEDQLARTFGGSFARDAMGLPTGSWQGPIASSYGLHLVWVVERRAARTPALDEVRRSVRDAVERERGDLAMLALLSSLRERYAVEE